MNEKSDKSLKANKQLHVLNNSYQLIKDNLLDCSLPPNSKLTADGWERRFIADARMAQDAIDTYSELGYEVKLVPFNAVELNDECRGCKTQIEQFSVIYTRKKKVK